MNQDDLLSCRECRTNFSGMLARKAAMEHIRSKHKKQISAVSRRTGLTPYWAGIEVFNEVFAPEKWDG